MEKVGRIAFIIGVLLSIVAGYIMMVWMLWTLTILGLVVGILNVKVAEVQTFLIAAVSLVIISALGGQLISNLPQIGSLLGNIYAALLTFVAPATIVVALKALFTVAKD